MNYYFLVNIILLKYLIHVQMFVLFILIPQRDKTAITIARAIMHHAFLKYGAGELPTDNGTEFRNELLN